MDQDYQGGREAPSQAHYSYLAGVVHDKARALQHLLARPCLLANAANAARTQHKRGGSYLLAGGTHELRKGDVDPDAIDELGARRNVRVGRRQIAALKHAGELVEEIIAAAGACGDQDGRHAQQPAHDEHAQLERPAHATDRSGYRLHARADWRKVY